MALRMSDAASQRVVQALATSIDQGTGTTGGKVRIYSGTRPAALTTALTSQVLLVDFLMPNPAFAAATSSGGVATASANAVAVVSSSASGTATWFRVIDRDGNILMDGTVSDTAGTGDLRLSTTLITAATDVTLTSFTLTQATS